MKYDLVKQKERIKVMAPHYFELVMFVLGLILGAVSLDLLGEDSYTFSLASAMFVYSIVYSAIWLVDAIIYFCIKKHREKKEGKNNNETR